MLLLNDRISVVLMIGFGWFAKKEEKEITSDKTLFLNKYL